MGRDFKHLRDDDTKDQNTPVMIATHVTAITAKEKHSLYVTDDGNLWVIGENDRGALGINREYQNTPERLASVTNVVAVTTGRFESLYATGDGKSWRIGTTHGSKVSPEPTFSASADDVTAMASGDGCSLYVTGHNKLWASGSNTNGKLGVGDTVGRDSLTLVFDLSDTANIAPAVTTHPVSQTSVAGRDVTLNVTATGTPMPAYLWHISKDNGSTWTPLDDKPPYGGVTTDTLIISNVALSMNKHQYHCVVKNPVCVAESDPAILTINDE